MDNELNNEIIATNENESELKDAENESVGSGGDNDLADDKNEGEVVEPSQDENENEGEPSDDEPSQDDPQEPSEDEPEPEPEPDFWDELLNKFLRVYPEFKPALNTGDEEKDADMKERFIMLLHKISCLYPEFNDLERCENKFPYFMLVAHYALMSGLGDDLGLLAQNGLVASSSVGGVSVSYQAAPYGSDEFNYWLSLTPYGKEYLAWMARQAGLTYVNN